ERRVAGVRVTVRERGLLRLDHEVHEIGAAPLVSAEAEALGDRELLEQDVALRDRRLAEHAQAAVLDRERVRAVDVECREVLARDRAAGGRYPADEALGEVAAVEGVGALACGPPGTVATIAPCSG